MSPEERKQWQDLMQAVVELNRGHADLVKQMEVLNQYLVEQAKKIAELYEKIDGKLNGSV